MRKINLVLAMLLLLPLFGWSQQVKEDTFTQLKVHYTTPSLKTLDAGEYQTLFIEDYQQGGQVGSPAIPVQTSLLVVPFCAEMQVIVENATYDTLTLDRQIMPQQPSRCKKDQGESAIVINKEVYRTDAFYSLPLAEVELLGVGRDRNYAQLRYSPVSVNPVSNKMIVCRSADITVRYVNADEKRTLDVYNLYHTPGFSMGNTLNTLLSETKIGQSNPPLRMVIVAPETLLCQGLNDFVEWKRTQGLLTDIIYTTSQTTADSIASILHTMYTEATEDSPAPTYLLLVGDVAQLPAFDSHLPYGGYWGTSNDHITDLYYTTWTTNDNLPDCYWGRFSATDTTTLNAIIDKTLYYERYEFSDDDYLSRGILIAGVDQGNTGDNGYTYADPTMDYAAYHYINADNGFTNVTYYKNNTSFAPTGVSVTGSSQSNSTAPTLRTLYNDGAGWINYSAHGDWNEWSSPSFTINNISRMNNNGKPSVMIGNCCLSNKFNKATCFGEALLRRNNRGGAIAYIGGTDYTYWGEDFNWSVGIRNNVSNTMSPDYNASNMGMYDHLFHTHGEPMSDWMVTTGKMIVMGNMSVENSTSDLKQYYWEIYQLMGDPSLMPWLGKASTMNATASILVGEIMVQAVAGAYVALVQNGTLQAQAAAYAGSNGQAYLVIPNGVDVHDCFISITAQNYKPAIITASQMGLEQANASQTSLSPNPASVRCNITADGLREVVMMNLMGQTLSTTRATDGQCTVSLKGVPSGIYLLRLNTATGTITKKLVVK